MESFEWLPDEEKSSYVDELYQALTEMEEEYQWTQSPELKLKMLATAREINDLLIK